MNSSNFTGLAGTWSMQLSASAPAAESSFSLEQTAESLFDPDHRSPVDETDLRDGGKYRSIVKLQMRYEKQDARDRAYAMGTGWLIRPDLLVTSGHNVYNWSAGANGEGLGKAVHIKCYIGYHGRDSVGTPAVQQRLAKNVVTTGEWLSNRDNRHRDVAFIQVDRPFEGNLRLFSYLPTPKSGDEMLGVVGYPADKILIDTDGREEKGAVMYEQFTDVQYNLEDPKNKPTMLKYRISTFGGQSGAPVIRKGAKPAVIATHVYGGGDKNQASPIGKFGNDYDLLLGVFSQRYPAVAQHEGINIVNPSAAVAAAPVPAAQPTLPVRSVTTNGATNGYVSNGYASNGLAPLEAEGWFESLKSVAGVVARVGTKALPLVSPLLGPIGAPVSAIAGAALGAVANVCAESAMDGGVGGSLYHDPLTASSVVDGGSIERAVLAEATLHAVLQMEDNPVTRRILDDMRKTYTALAPNVKPLSRRLAPGLLKSAYTIGLRQDYGGGARNGNGAVGYRQQRAPLQAARKPLRGELGGSNFGAESAFGGGNASAKNNDFLDAMLQPTRPLEGEEAFFARLGGFITTGVRIAKPLLREGAKAGFELVNRALAESSFDAEAGGFGGGGEAADENARAAELVARRAVMGEAALQAVMRLGGAELRQLTVLTGGEDEVGRGGVGGDLQEEGFIDFVKTAAQRIGSVVKDAAPAVIDAIVPVVARAVRPEAAAPAALAAPRPPLRGKRSILNLINDGTLKVSAPAAAITPDVMVDGDGGRAPDLAAIRPELRHVDSNKDLPVFQEL